MLLAFPVTLSAQTLTGKVVDENTSLPIEFANVVLLQRSDSAFVAGTATDSLGFFSINGNQGNYLLKVSFMGYQTRFIDVNSANLGTIILSGNEKELSEVTVSGQRPVFKMESRGISVDIQNSRLKEIGNAMYVLGQLPLVDFSAGSLTVFGKGTPLIYINNRLVRNYKELEQLNSEQIKKVTVITNPSAEYDASIKSVIKIETLKQQGDGLSGSALLGGGTKQFLNFNYAALINLNYHFNHLDIFTTVSYNNSADITPTINSTTTYHQTNRTLVIQDSGRRTYPGQFINSEVGAVYSFNKNHETGIRYKYSGMIDYTQNQQNDESVYLNDVLQEQYHSIQNTIQNTHPHYLNAYYNGTFAQWLSAKLNIDFANGNTVTNQTYTDPSSNVITN